MNSEEQHVMLEFMGIVGETTDRARQFLEATNWVLEEAVKLYFAESNNEVGGTSLELPTSVSGRMVEDVRPPLPVIREALYGDGEHHMQYPDEHIQYPGHSFVDPFRNFGDEANQQSSSAAGEGSAPVLGVPAHDSLAALYRPPLDCMFHGTFQQAKLEAARQGKWLLVNLQSTSKFASHTLNRDTWGHEAVKAVVSTSFVFWQVQDDTEEGMKVRTFYKVTMVPSILVIDCVTGQKMRSWQGMIDAESLLEKLEQYIDHGPLENHPIRFPVPRQSTKNAMLLDVADKELSVGLDLSSTVGSSVSSSVSEAYSDLDEEIISPVIYPSLHEEPEIKTPGACRVGIRFPDSSRTQRRFMMSDSVKLLWSFCSSQVKEAEEGRQFHLIQTLPGANNSLEYSLDATMGEAGVANSMLSMMWN